MNYFKNVLVRSIRQRSFLATLIAAFVVGIGMAAYFKVMEPINVQAEITARKAQAIRLVDNYQNYQNQVENKETYQLLLDNNTLSNRQASNLIMEELGRFNRTSAEIAAIQLKLWDSSLPDKTFLQPIWQLQQNRVVSLQLETLGKDPVLTASNTQTAIALTIQLMMGIGFFFFAFFASDNLLEEKRHFSLIRSYPQIFPIRMVSKVFVKLISHLATMGAFLMGIFVTMLLIGELGDWNYPTAIYYQQSWYSLPFWQYFLVAMFFLIGLIFLVELLGFVMNVFMPNRYVSFFSLCLCYGIGTLSSLSFSKYSPFSLFNLQKIISGEYAVNSHSTTGLELTILLLLLWSIAAISFLLVADKKNWLLKGVI